MTADEAEAIYDEAVARHTNPPGLLDAVEADAEARGLTPGTVEFVADCLWSAYGITL